eukprot:TRINITY_DN51347_c0_g1_i1.p1 TRINITY_DN51347_c0_g1~~TRINITY_DN51347_c0_g1_i1.p1  ORF type:complete len:159 (-),score=18.48 TRINITY_DN51347_c0_g1_i1:69-545(-)
MTLDMWEMQVASLCAQGFTVLRYDMFGHGRSSCAPSICFELATFVQQLDEIIAAVLPSSQSVDLIGFSLGGLVALEYAARASGRERCQSLLLLDSCGLAAPFLPLNCTGAFVARGVYSAVRLWPIRAFSAAAGGLLLGWFARAYDVKLPDRRHAVRTV